MSHFHTAGYHHALHTVGLLKHAGIAGIALSDSATSLADKYIDITGKPVDAGEALLKSLGLAEAPNLVRRDQLPAVPLSAQGSPPVEPATPVLSKQSAMSGPPEDIKREAPEWHLPPAPHSTRRHRGLLEGELQSSESDEITRREEVPGDNEPQVGSGGGGGGSLSHAGAEVSVPDQTPQRQAMTLYDVPSSDVGNIWEHYDRRLQNPATNSIIRFVSE